jgi:septum formation protein
LKNKKYILASQSPRRKELLSILDIDFTIQASEICEDLKEDLSNEEIVIDLAYQKAVDVFSSNQDAIVLGFDTLVVLDGVPLGKPVDEDDAFRMLKSLAGREHQVLTGCAIVGKGIQKTFYDYATVTFNPMTDEEIREYIATSEPFDKAGAYGIQGYAARYINRVEGDYYSVMGMPIQKLYNFLRDL